MGFRDAVADSRLPMAHRRLTIAGRRLSESGHNKSFRKNDMFSFELELISAASSPKRGNRALSIRIRAQSVFLQKRHIFTQIRAYPPLYRTRRGETERPLSESGHNESFYKKDVSPFKLELISIVSNPKGGNRALSIRIRAQ